jgi:predicted nuclease with TOPRIM domain
MLPKKLHLEQIERFHAKLDEIDKAIEKCKDREDLKDYVGKLSMQWYKLSKVWTEIDNVVEMRIKHEIDCMEDEPNGV